MPRSLLIISHHHHAFGFSPTRPFSGKRERKRVHRLYGMSMRYLSRLEITKGVKLG